VADGIAVIILNRPQATNALNRALHQRQDWVLRGFRQFDAPVCVIVTYEASCPAPTIPPSIAARSPPRWSTRRGRAGLAA